MRKRLKACLWISLFSATLVLSSCHSENRLNSTGLIAQRDTAMSLLKQERELVATLEKSLEGCSLPESTIGRLRRLGLSDPLEDLSADLCPRAELIPLNPDPNGLQWSFDCNDIRVLNLQWVIAGINDGHGGGHLLLEHTIEGGVIRWKPLLWAID
jgi:hypothetical protein